MDNRIVAIENYWASVVRNTEEFKQIALAMNPEFNKLAECIKRMLQDSFVNNATEYGVSRWESMLKLAPNPDDTLEDRKIRVLTYLNIRLPYTWRTLQQMISSFVGENNFTMKFYNDISTLEVRVTPQSESTLDTIVTMLNSVVPQNVVIDLGELK